MTSRTPGKLYVSKSSNDSLLAGEAGRTLYIARVFGTGGKSGGEWSETDKANAERLAHCWNCHDELVAELKSALATIEGEYPKHQHAEYRVPEMRALIAKAEGK